MKTLHSSRTCAVVVFVAGIFFSPSLLWSADPAELTRTHGGLVVQLGAGQLDTARALSETGRFLVHILDADDQSVSASRETLQKDARYGMVWAEPLGKKPLLPYAENIVNLVNVLDANGISVEEIFRVLTPEGKAVFQKADSISSDVLEKAGFTHITKTENSLMATKPWPAEMDVWSHPRHDANGNAVSQDTLVGPPDRVRWIAAATSEVEGLVAAGGRNFYGGVLARDSFNGLRLWHFDPASGKTNDPDYKLRPLSRNLGRPVASAKFLFAVSKGKLVALNAATGELVREFPDLEKPNEIITHREMVVASDEKSIRAYSTETGKELWSYEAAEPRNVIAGNDIVTMVHGRPKRGEKSEAVALDLYSGELKWKGEFPWLDKVTRTVMHGKQLAYEVSTLSDHDDGNAIHIVSNETGVPSWDKAFAPGMNHQRQARAMFLNDDVWILHGGKLNTADKENMTRQPVQVSALDTKTGETKKSHDAGLTHCFPPVATPRFVIAGELDMTDIETGDVLANRITKANCSRENGWVPANGLVYTTPKHCTCWPMLRGFVAMAAKPSDENHASNLPLEKLSFPVKKGSAVIDPEAAAPAETDWPLYRNDRWRSGSTPFAGPESLNEKWSTSVASALEVASLNKAPAGAILHDWKENPFIKGPVSAPVIANGRVFVSRPDAHQVVALSADTGEEIWRFTSEGRVDTPPSIHKGLAIFGNNAGYVHALRADTGELVWKMQAAPIDERIVAYGQVESAYPVPGSVLIMDDLAYFSAGRQPFADGGVLVFAIDPMTGEKKWVTRVDTLPQKGYYENSGLEFDPVDIMHVEGDRLAMSRWLLKMDGSGFDVDKWNAFAHLDTGKGAVYVPRGSWTYGPRHQHRFRGEAPRRPLAVWRDGNVVSSLNGSTELFLRDFELENGEEFSAKWITGWEAAQKGNKGEKPFRTYRIAEKAKWKADPFIAKEDKDKEFVPGTQVYNDVHALALTGTGDDQKIYAIHKDGRLKVVAATDGTVLQEKTVPAPAWDGLAVANGKLFLSTLDGRVLCLAD